MQANAAVGGRLRPMPSSRAKELDFLQFEVQEIEAAHLIPGEDEELESILSDDGERPEDHGSALRGRESDRGERLFRGRAMRLAVP